MGFGSLFSRNSQEPRQPQNGELARRHDEPPHVANDLALNADSRHPAWKSDLITSSTGGESMRISTVRQLSRTLGTILAGVTNDSGQSRDVLREVQGYQPKVNDYSTLLNMTVEAIVGADNFRDATPAVVRAWKELARENNLQTSFLTLGLVAVTRDSCTEMLQDLLSKPADRDCHGSMDGSIMTSFHANGDVKEINIKVLNGHFSSAFIKTLREVEGVYKERQSNALLNGEKPLLVRPEMAQVVLTVDNSFRKANDTHFFKLTSADFIQGYIAATFDYAAVGYADRVRSGRA
jgi:hypothetical protein